MDETRRVNEETIQLQRGIQRLNAGDTSVRGELLNIACQRLMRLTSRLRRDFQGLDGDANTRDVFENASLRLYQAMHDEPIHDVRHFYRLAAIQIRCELIQLCHYCQGLGDPSPTDAVTDRVAVDELRQWAFFHHCVDALPGDQREVFELIWYHELNRDETATLLAVPRPHVRRLWRSARVNLHDLLDGGRFPNKSVGN
jgi:RNA polymerase sigma-70 factor (ECF subfamily)